MEAPRELRADQITQYTMLEGSMSNTADILLLVRPDFVIFDELRKNEDFNVFADMRLPALAWLGSSTQMVYRMQSSVFPTAWILCPLTDSEHHYLCQAGCDYEDIRCRFHHQGPRRNGK